MVGTRRLFSATTEKGEMVARFYLYERKRTKTNRNEKSETERLEETFASHAAAHERLRPVSIYRAPCH